MIQISFGVDQYSINIVEIWPFLLKKKCDQFLHYRTLTRLFLCTSKITSSKIHL